MRPTVLRGTVLSLAAVLSSIHPTGVESIVEFTGEFQDWKTMYFLVI